MLSITKYFGNPNLDTIYVTKEYKILNQKYFIEF